MLCNPRPGQRVRVWYCKALAHMMPLHGQVGVVRIVGHGKPRNHGIEVDGKTYAVNCGHLQTVDAKARKQ